LGSWPKWQRDRARSAGGGGKRRALAAPPCGAIRRAGKLAERAARRARAPAGAAIERHLHALQQDQAAVRAAAGGAADEVAERLTQLETRLDVAEHSLAADLSDQWPRFAAAVEAELRSWDTTSSGCRRAPRRERGGRARAEAAIRDLRSRRIAVDERLTQARGAAGDARGEQRRRVMAARDELQQKADALSATFT
jgi:hypothetical protein